MRAVGCLLGVCVGMSSLVGLPAAAQDPNSECGGSASSVSGSGSSGDASSLGPMLTGNGGGGMIGQTVINTVVDGVVAGSRWAGDYHGRTYPAGGGSPAPVPANPGPASASSTQPITTQPGPNTFGVGIPGADYVARGAWNAGTWAGTPSAPEPPADPAPAANNQDTGGVWVQPMLR